MPRLVLDIGPLIIEETKTRKQGRTVYRFYTRNSTNNTASMATLARIRNAIHKELRNKNFTFGRETWSKKYWDANKDKINAKRRERYAQRKKQQKNGSSL